MITKTEYREFASNFFDECLRVSDMKNADYTGQSPDPFANFKSVEGIGIPVEIGFLTRMMDKISRIKSFADQGLLQVREESVTDTLRDLANYSCLLAGYIESNRVNTIQNVVPPEEDLPF